MSVVGQSRQFGDVQAISALPLIADVRREDRQVRKVPQAEMRCRLYFIASAFLDFRLLLKQGERIKHEEHDLAKGLHRTQRSDLIICARFHHVPCREAPSKATLHLRH
jgi:hypothetical protein